MKHRIIITGDGSHTLYIPGLDESYHSRYGAINESMHVFINAGLARAGKKNLKILEAGFGTGLNALLSWQYSVRHNLDIYYYSIEKNPLPRRMAGMLNYPAILGEEAGTIFREMHRTPWDTDVEMAGGFILHKTTGDILETPLPGLFDLVYFDAFSPDKQPELWTEELFGRIFREMAQGGILTTYSAKGSVRRMLQSSGFSVETLPGPPGKRQIIRATKTY